MGGAVSGSLSVGGDVSAQSLTLGGTALTTWPETISTNAADGRYVTKAGDTMTGALNIRDIGINPGSNDRSEIDFIDGTITYDGNEQINFNQKSTASTTLWTNWNADLLDGLDASTFASSSQLTNYVNKAGDTISGGLTIGGTLTLGSETRSTWPTTDTNLVNSLILTAFNTIQYNHVAISRWGVTRIVPEGSKAE